jgi:hypothetical protein
VLARAGALLLEPHPALNMMLFPTLQIKNVNFKMSTDLSKVLQVA